MRPFDVVVVGAGPAGSTSARLLAEQGARVVLLEAHRLPRPKLCGGGLTPKAQRLIPPSALVTIERWVERVELRGPRVPPIHLWEPAARIAMVERSRFDYALVEAASTAGAEIRDRERVREIVEDPLGAWIVTDRERLRAGAVVLADGEPSTLSRRLGLGGQARRLSLALEVDLPFAPGWPSDTSVLSFDVPGGFAWYFPKGGHANVGVGSYRIRDGANLRHGLDRFVRSLGLDLRDGRIAGHWIPQGLRQGSLASARVALAGDAAATADPLFGEGISYAILSGVVAAKTIGDWAAGELNDLSEHDARLRRALAPALDRLGLVARAVETSITLALFAIRYSSWVRESAVGAIAGRRAPFAVDRDCRRACACTLSWSPRDRADAPAGLLHAVCSGGSARCAA